MNTLIISGSPRKNSLTVRVAKAIAKHLAVANPVHLIDFNRYDIPFLNAGKLSPDNLTDFQAELVNKWNEASLVIILSPEYNWFPSAELVNMVNQLGNRSFKNLFDGKVFAFVGTSSGRGGRIPAMQLHTIFNKLISALSTHSIVSGKSFESQFTQLALDEEGNSLGNVEYDNGLAAFADYSLKMAERWVKEAEVK